MSTDESAPLGCSKQRCVHSDKSLVFSHIKMLFLINVIVI